MRGGGRALTAAALLLLPGACAEPPQELVPSAETPSTLWHELGAWSGRGDRQTESFDITTGALRLAWRAAEAEGAGASRFRVSLHSAISGRPLETIVDERGSGVDTASFAASPRVAYLLIESEGVDWTLGLDEALTRSAAPAGAAPQL